MAGVRKQPLRSATPVTDDFDALIAEGHTNLILALDNLCNDRKILLWVVYVGGFAGLDSVAWAQ
jgi:hypothetical protein